jgi:hypothetical protein
MRWIVWLEFVVLVVLSGCSGSPDTGWDPTTGSTAVSSSSTIRESTTTTTATASTTTTAPATTTLIATTTTTLLSIDRAESGLFCRDLHAMGHSYTEAVTYWVREGSPDRMDADRNGIPCETVYPLAEVVEFWGEPLPTTTTTMGVFFSIVTHGPYPNPLPRSGGWFGSGCSPGSDTLPDGIWWGYITDLSPSSITFDLACLRWIPDPNDDAIEEGGWEIVNDNPRVRIVPVRPDTLVACDWMHCPPSPFPYSEWIEDDRLPHGDQGREGGLWLYVNNGAVTEISDEGLAG